MIDVLTFLFQWAVVFFLNIIPAFAPPTWVVLSAMYITTPQNIFILIFIGVTASTCGRYALARLSGFVAERYTDKKKQMELQILRDRINRHQKSKFIFTLIFSLSPLPSNALFIAAGATKVRMQEVIAGFFVGRTISYLFLVFTTQKVFASFESTLAGNASLWTIMIEVIGLIAIIGFFFFDWTKVLDYFEEKQVGPKRKRWEHPSNKK